MDSLFVDIHPVEMRWEKLTYYPCDKMMFPIITMDLFATAKRVDVCNYLWSKKGYAIVLLS